MGLSIAFRLEVVLRESSDNEKGFVRAREMTLHLVNTRVIKIIKSKLRRDFKLYGFKPCAAAFHRAKALQYIQN